MGEAITVPSLTMMSSTGSEESLARNTHTRTDFGLVYLKSFESRKEGEKPRPVPPPPPPPSLPGGRAQSGMRPPTVDRSAAGEDQSWSITGRQQEEKPDIPSCLQANNPPLAPPSLAPSLPLSLSVSLSLLSPGKLMRLALTICRRRSDLPIRRLV